MSPENSFFSVFPIETSRFEHHTFHSYHPVFHPSSFFLRSIFTINHILKSLSHLHFSHTPNLKTRFKTWFNLYVRGVETHREQQFSYIQVIKSRHHHRRRINRHHSRGFDYMTEMDLPKTFRKAEKICLLGNIEVSMDILS